MDKKRPRSLSPPPSPSGSKKRRNSNSGEEQKGLVQGAGSQSSQGATGSSAAQSGVNAKPRRSSNQLATSSSNAANSGNADSKAGTSSTPVSPTGGPAPTKTRRLSGAPKPDSKNENSQQENSKKEDSKKEDKSDKAVKTEGDKQIGNTGTTGADEPKKRGTGPLKTTNSLYTLQGRRESNEDAHIHFDVRSF